MDSILLSSSLPADFFRRDCDTVHCQLAVWAARNHLRITLVVDSVTAVMELRELMWRLGIKAAPLLGSANKDAQLTKMHMVTHCDSLSDLSDKVPFHMLSVICPLNGLRTDSFSYASIHDIDN